MKRSSLPKASGLAALALTMSFGLAACGGDANSEPTAAESKASAPAKESAESEPMADDAGAETFGPGCSAIPTTGDGSFNGMATVRLLGHDQVRNHASDLTHCGQRSERVRQQGTVNL